MLIRFPEQNFNNFIIPAFQINEGEIVVIKLPDGILFEPISSEIKNLLSGTLKDNLVQINSEFKLVEHFKEGFFNYHFFPVTIDRYHKKHANKGNPIYKEIYNTPWLTPNMKVNTLHGTMRKKLAIYTTLSWTNRLIIDLVGVDPKGGVEIFDIIKRAIKPNGAVVLIDRCDEFKHQCTTYIEVNYVGDDIESEISKFILKSK